MRSRESKMIRIKTTVEMKINIILILILLVLILISGCTKEPDEMLNYNFKDGLKEMKASLAKNNPPETVYPDSPFKIIVLMENLGAYDVQNLKISLLGLDDKYFLMMNLAEELPLLAGRSMFNPSGEKQYAEFSGQSGQLAKSDKSIENNFLVQMSYSSKMEFVEDICVNPSLYDIDSGCKAEKKSYSGQGAPLAIVSMEEIIYPGDNPEVELRLMMRNKGEGTVKEVSLNNAKMGGKDASCNFLTDGGEAKKIKMNNLKEDPVIVCRMVAEGGKSYATPMYMEFSYDYELLLRKNIKLVKGVGIN
jgi:hypothetical protein